MTEKLSNKTQKN